MSLHIHFDQIAAFLTQLRTKDADDKREAFLNEVMETGGNYTAPRPEMRDSTHLYEIQLHGVSAFGFGEDEAIHNWQKAAHRICNLIEDDGFVTVHPPFPTPRNHGEEIANVRAEFRGQPA